MKRLFRSTSARSSSDDGSIASMPPSYQAIEASSDIANLQTNASSSDSRLVAQHSPRSAATPSKPIPVVLAYTPEETTRTSADSDPGLRMGYCYYRIYTLDGAVPSKTAFNPRNPYLGRIPIRSVPPPQKVGSLQRCLVTAERFPGFGPESQQVLLNADGFIKAAGMRGDEPILLNAEVPGSAPYGTTPETAFALLLIGVEFPKPAIAGRRPRIPTRIPTEAHPIYFPTEAHPIYLYYRLFTRIGEDTSKVRFSPNDQALGRIERILVAPPHTARSIKHQIATLEGKRIYAYADLYASISAPQPTENTAYLSLMQDDSPGLREDNPIVLVQPERRPKLQNRPVEVVLAYRVDEWDCHQHLAVGLRGLSDGVLIGKAVFCKVHENWDSNCACGQGVSGTLIRSVTRVFWCDFVFNRISYKTYVPARYIKFLDE
ncbi:hypothetical protein MSAN_02207300 [Mycena sanguinolenta]|uniref:Uncharacterized protein n=1 Tax=Mycena sanguinolenta TaxID=230812 RepID=A0A8H7CIE5_9AGAR|nr:hypothetical protein MSAN_02207300 [Mycena sanguinolenta]